MSQIKSNLASHSHWAQLPVDLWRLIFKHMTKEFIELPANALFHLPLVCVRFRNIFDQQAQLSESFYFRQCSYDKLASMIAWVRRHGAQVKHVCSSNPQMVAVLGALLSHKAPLQRITLGSSSGAIQLISAFHTLRQCNLTMHLTTPEGAQDLEPLQALPNLDSLSPADATFKNLQAAVHLTSLQLSHCTALGAQDCVCATSLLRLAMINASLEDFHNMGLIACCYLESLTVSNSDLIAGHMMHLEDLSFTRDAF